MIHLPSAIDITLPMGPDMLLYPGDTPPSIHRLSAIAEGASLTASEIVMGCHLGAHVDAPAHFIAGGVTVDALELRHFYGRAVVVEIANRDRITTEDIDGVGIPSGYHVLIKTENSELLHRNQFEPNYCFLTPAATDRLLQLQPLSIGFDYYSFDPPSGNSFPSHLATARRGIPAFVCLDLKDVTPGEYLFVAMPLNLPEVEAVPVRAVLFK